MPPQRTDGLNRTRPRTCPSATKSNATTHHMPPSPESNGPPKRTRPAFPQRGPVYPCRQQIRTRPQPPLTWERTDRPNRTRFLSLRCGRQIEHAHTTPARLTWERPIPARHLSVVSRNPRARLPVSRAAASAASSSRSRCATTAWYAISTSSGWCSVFGAPSLHCGGRNAYSCRGHTEVRVDQNASSISGLASASGLLKRLITAFLFTRPAPPR